MKSILPIFLAAAGLGCTVGEWGLIPFGGPFLLAAFLTWVKLG